MPFCNTRFSPLWLPMYHGSRFPLLSALNINAHLTVTGRVIRALFPFFSLSECPKEVGAISFLPCIRWTPFLFPWHFLFLTSNTNPVLLDRYSVPGTHPLVVHLFVSFTPPSVNGYSDEALLYLSPFLSDSACFFPP